MANIDYTKIQYKFNGGINLDYIEKESMNLTDNFICSICLGLVLKPVLCQENECIFCQECIDNWLKKQKECPNCKKVFVKNPTISRLLKNIILKIKIKCIYVSNGCTKSINYENYIDHIETCDYASYECKYDGCNFSSNKNDIIKHVETCQFKRIICENCKGKFSLNEIKDHQGLCKKICPICKSNIELSAVGTHNNGLCYQTLVNFYLNYNKIEINKSAIKENSNSISSKDVTPVLRMTSNLSQSNHGNLINSSIIKSTIPLISKNDNILKNTFQYDINCHKVLNLSTLTLIKPNLNFRFNCFMCKNSVICRLQCNKCKLYSCYKCYYSKTKNYCPSINSHVLMINNIHTFSCDICQTTITSNSYKDFECQIEICEACTKKY